MLTLGIISLVTLAVLSIQWIRASEPSIIDIQAVKQWQQRLVSQESELDRTREHTEEQIRALTVKLAELQSRLTRLDALGERLVDVAELDDGEFDFTIPPGVGGPETEAGSYTPPDIVGALDSLSSMIDDREQQLSVLNSLLGDRKIQSATFVAGRPIERGWMSSRYGYRNDPFTGDVAWHDGVDFAGKDGSNIIAVAAGVVTWASERYGYGNMVEINHGNGYVTRYAHAKEVLVNVGDVVKKNDVIALMGSTGRSTGPHTHFEVHHRGRSVDPAEYINRVARF
ncbi:peptidoglycan DD-metalloendopeptidase family protein [Saccharospirillum sp. HFRX-1]|uniref:M23 family metallopeptidase n=1 Tax=unclassified Saccharospirillum TaxID=2633430 RepID=UPI003717D526